MKNRKNVVSNSTLNIDEILIVEDSPTQASQIRHLLESRNYLVLIAKNGTQAMDQIMKHKPSLVISDILMPEMNGYELCKWIKSNKNTENIPVILLTRLTDPEEIIEGLSCGADSFITKPYNEKYLLSNVEKFFSEGNKEDLNKVPFGVQILFKGKKRLIQAEQQNVIKLILDIYEGAIHQNEKLIQTQEELKLLNEQLESAVEERTSDLREEMSLSNHIGERLKESEEKFRKIFEDHVAVKLLIDPYTGEIIDANKAAANYYGWSREEFKGMKMEKINTLTFKEIKKEMEKAVSKKRTHFEFRHRLKDGSIRDVEVFSSIIKIRNKDMLHSIIHDITDRKKAEEKIKSLVSRQETILSTVPNIIMEVDKNKVYKWSNKSGFEFFGKDVIGREANSFFIGNQDTYEVIQTLFDGKEDEVFVENWQRRQDGEKRFLSWCCRAIKGANGEVTGTLSSALDITDRNQMQEALRESEEKFRSIMENSADAIFITDKQGKYIYTNKEVTRMLGFTSEEMKSKTILDITPKNQADKNLKIFKEVLNEGNVFAEIELLKKDGNFISTDLNSVLLPGGLIYGSCRDITERKIARNAMVYAMEKAEASDKLKTTFLNNISHEVRTPLNGILGFAEIISQPDLSTEDKTDSLSMLRESSNRLLNTITNYMDISMLTSDNISIHKSDFSPTLLLKEIFENYRTLCLGKHLELFLEIRGETNLLSINSDKEILRKILSHLLDNAIKFTEKGKISYGYSIQKEDLEFFVKDTGIGMAKESIDLVFDRFAKEERGTLKFTEGSGLGLSIAKGLTEKIGGKIRVESDVDLGSCFYFTIPLIKTQEMILSSSPGAEHKKHLNEYTILVAEDDETNFFYLKTLLSRVTKAKILHAVNGMEAIELFKLNKGIALILMDIKMPIIDGFEATRKIKLINKEVPVIALTAFAMSGDEERVRAAGCDDYLSKPVSRKSLLEKMARYVNL